MDLIVGADPAAVRAAVERIAQAQTPTNVAGRCAEAAHAETVLLLSQGAAAEDASEQPRAAGRQTSGSVTYDSPERRSATAATLATVGGMDQAAVATRMRADVSQGRPATHATAPAPAPGRAPTARRTKAAAQIQRSDPSR